MENNEFHSNTGKKPKPLKKLVRSGQGMQEGYHGKYEAESGEYHGQHEAAPKPNRNSAPKLRYVRPEERRLRQLQNKQLNRNPNKKKKNAPPTKKEVRTNIIVKCASIVLTLVMSLFMVFNMPILVDSESKENVSIINYIKNLKPAKGEGDLDKSNIDLMIDPDLVVPDFNDGLDLPQLIEGQYSILFLGFEPDAYNTDVMWVIQFDIGHSEINILQIPRDTCLPDYTSSVTRKFNSIYTMGDQSIQPPIQRTVNAVQENFGIPIDAYVTTTCPDIVKIIDIIGGVPIHLDNEIIFEADKIIPAGDVTLSGEQSEWFIRFRREWLQGDIGRMQNQRRFMAAAMQKLMSIVEDEGRIKLYSYIKEIYDKDLMFTDLSIGDLGKIADFCSTVSMKSVRVNMVPGEDASFYAADGNVYSVYSVHKRATIDLLNEYYRPYQKPMTSQDTTIVELVTDYQYTLYDDTGATLEELEDATEPVRDPNKKPWWKKD